MNNWIILSSPSSHFSYSDVIFREPFIPFIPKYLQNVRKFIPIGESGENQIEEKERIFKEEEGINFDLKKKKKKTNPISETRIGIKYSFLLCRTRTSLGGAQSSWKKLDADKRRRRRGRGASKGKLFCVEKSRMLVSRKWICRVEKRRLEL